MTSCTEQRFYYQCQMNTIYHVYESPFSLPVNQNQHQMKLANGCFPRLGPGASICLVL